MNSKESTTSPSSASSDFDYQDEHNTFLGFKKRSNDKKTRCVTILLVLALLVSNGTWLFHEKKRSSALPMDSHADAEHRVILRPQHWDTPYSGDNKTETNALWKGLFPDGAGLVHIPRAYASELQLPQSVPYKGNVSERTYFVAAYHNIHCLSVIRAALYHFEEGVPQTVPIKHTHHCLDSLRQDTMCHADKTLLYTENGKVFGDGQVRKCRDWDALNEWIGMHHVDL
ncbi:hypothetical protein DE146DRAFT_649808 [Phaeosphaeria sp. MPI-PUGE-AT-0046c]|nr:hypothetical protein DE146DRAFT_649808 [Phaeosphaeria sp. MPI-PUGE-AT-0046c]